MLNTNVKLLQFFRLLSDSGRACDSIRILLESIRVNFVHLTNLNLESGHSLLYGSRNEPQFYSIIYCSFDSYNNVTSNVSLKSELDLYSLKYGIGQILMSHAEDAGNISIVGVRHGLKEILYLGKGIRLLIFHFLTKNEKK